MKTFSIPVFQDFRAVDTTTITTTTTTSGRSRIFSYHFKHNSKPHCFSLVVLPSSSSSPRKRHNRCCVSVSSSSSFVTMEKEVGETTQQRVFDAKEAALLVGELRRIYKSGRTRSYEWRLAQIKGIEKMVDERENQIKEALFMDLSKPPFEAFMSEITMIKSSCQKAQKELKRWMKPEKVKTTMTTYPSSAEIISEPLGVVLIISAWNYPFLLSMDPIIGAIAAGNAVVLKPSEIAPATSSLLVKLIGEYMDTNAIRVVEGAVPETAALLEHKWNKIFYTGSCWVGRIVMAAAAKHLTPVTLELGGKCPAIVDSNVKLDVAVRRIVAGKWALNNGQACIAVDYIITTESFAPKLIDALRSTIEEFFGKNPMESRDISRIVNAFHFARLVKLLDENGITDKIVLGGQRDEGQLKIAPTILLDPPEGSQIMQEEIFGPLLPIITVDKVQDAFDVVDSKPKPLTAYLFTNSDKLKKEFVHNISSGGMLVNDTVLHLTVPTLPFGGVEESGMGAYHGKFSFDAFSHKKGVLYRGFGGDSSARYPPYTPKKERLLRALLKGSIIGIIFALLGWSKN